MINELIRQLLASLPDWLSLFVIISVGVIAFVFFLVITFLLNRSILNKRWKKPAVHMVSIENKGNTNSFFQLLAFAPRDDLEFEYRLNGARLSIKEPPPIVPSPPSRPTEAALPDQQSTQPSIPSPAGAAPEPGTPVSDGEPGAGSKAADGAKKAAKGVKDKSKAGLGLGRIVSSILGTAGSLIPGSLGQSLKETSTSMQGQLQTADSASQMPEQKIKMAEHIKGQAGSLGEKVSGSPKDQAAAAAAPTQAATTITEPVPQSTVESTPQIQTGLEPKSTPSLEQPAAEEEQLPEYVETTALPPGESISLELRLAPHNQYHSGEYVYWLLSKQQILPGSLGQLPGEISTNTKLSTLEKTVHNFIERGISPVYGVLATLLLLFVIVINLTLAVLLFNWLIQLV